MEIWLRELGSDGYVRRHVDSLDGLCCEGRDEKTGLYLYYELPIEEEHQPEFDAKM